MKARDVVRLANIDSLTKALEFYYYDHNEYPDILDEPTFNWQDYYEEMYTMLHDGGYIGFNGNSSKFANFFIKKVLAVTSSVINIQDPLVSSRGEDWTYGYYNSTDKQSYILRVRFEKNDSGISKKRYVGQLILNGFTGGCDDPAYYCISSSNVFVPNTSATPPPTCGVPGRPPCSPVF